MQDVKLRVALENMRYKACTPDDIDFSKSRIAGKGLDDPKFAQKRFRNISVSPQEINKGTSLMSWVLNDLLLKMARHQQLSILSTD